MALDLEAEALEGAHEASDHLGVSLRSRGVRDAGHQLVPASEGGAVDGLDQRAVALESLDAARGGPALEPEGVAAGGATSGVDWAAVRAAVRARGAAIMTLEPSLRGAPGRHAAEGACGRARRIDPRSVAGTKSDPALGSAGRLGGSGRASPSPGRISPWPSP